MLACAFCGWRYDPAAFVGRPGVPNDPLLAVPPHDRVTNNAGEMSAAALDSGAAEEELACLGADSHPLTLEAA